MSVFFLFFFLFTDISFIYLLLLLKGLRNSPGAVRAWELTGQAKIAVKCPSVDELMSLRNEAASRGISFYLVVDAGRTQIAPNSRTVLAIGPAPVDAFDDFTKHLKLY